MENMLIITEWQQVTIHTRKYLSWKKKERQPAFYNQMGWMENVLIITDSY